MAVFMWIVLMLRSRQMLLNENVKILHSLIGPYIPLYIDTSLETQIRIGRTIQLRIFKPCENFLVVSKFPKRKTKINTFYT